MAEVALTAFLCMDKLPKHLVFICCSVVTALLFTLAWSPAGLFPLIFLAYLPVFYLEKQLRAHRMHAGWTFLYAFLTFMLLNVGCIWWIWNASPGGAVGAFVVNTLVMCLPFMLMFFVSRKAGGKKGREMFVWSWIAVEVLHLSWDLAFPWLTLGQVFATAPAVVQWYEYTGALGGSLWVLWTNKAIYQYLLKIKERSRVMNYSKALNLVFFLLFAPVFLSFYIDANYTSNGLKTKVMVVQPNIDPYKEKFEGLTPYEQTVMMLQLAEKHIDSTVSLVVFPETALVGNLNEDLAEQEESVKLIRRFMSMHPNLSVLSGADSYRTFKPGEKLSATARKYNDQVYYDSYNSAFMISPDERVNIYHKSKLVPGVERMPYPAVMKLLEPLAINLGGTVGSLGMDAEAKVLPAGKYIKAAPVICYESVFGDYVTDYVKKGANLICIITNDGWWDNTPGYKQHFEYARLRAVETRRYVARSANTGISGFINDKGQVLSKSEWWVPAALTNEVLLNNGETFYVKYGDYIGTMAVLFTAFSLLVNLRRKEELG